MNALQALSLQTNNNRSMLIKDSRPDRSPRFFDSFLGIMRNLFATFILLFAFLPGIVAQKNKKNKGEVSGDHYLIKGTIFLINPIEGTEGKASNVQVVVYQGTELFVAFFTGETGDYEFYLPIGHNYEVWYGGSAFVNKKVAIDATQLPKERKPRTILLNMGLFRPIENVEFPTLNSPFVIVSYDPEFDQIAPDMDYTAKKNMELEKVFKKLRKRKPKSK
jgi:hypothetical protein